MAPRRPSSRFSAPAAGTGAPSWRRPNYRSRRRFKSRPSSASTRVRCGRIPGRPPRRLLVDSTRMLTSVDPVAAFLGGLLSFLSPCVLALVPGYLAYLGGASVERDNNRRNLVLNAAIFVAGFSA